MGALRAKRHEPVTHFRIAPTEFRANNLFNAMSKTIMTNEINAATSEVLPPKNDNEIDAPDLPLDLPGDVDSDEDDDIIYTADLKVCATVYIRAKSIEEAQVVLSSLEDTPLYVSGEMIGETQFTDDFPEIEIAESMTIHGQFDGDVLLPRYDIANDIDYG
ncbi:hypothetical protein ACDY96_17900 [Rhizobium mongolense]|uniref:hypothetical protein n=1 Tax=Rhizobium mongolense TaxID=57676 RepID=UPI003555C548